VEQLYFYTFDALMLFYISFHSLPNINALCNIIDRERFISLEYITGSRTLAT